MDYNAMKIKDILAKSEDREILLPNFQREFVWNRNDNQKGLLTSIIYDIAIGSLLILNGDSDFFATKELCIRANQVQSDKDTCMYLLDGQQRLSTLKSIFFDFFNDPLQWKSKYEELYPNLATRWFLKIVPNENEIDPFGWRKLDFKGKSILEEYEPSQISDIIKYEKLYKNQNEKWYHPEYEIDKWYVEDKVLESRRLSYISKAAAKDGLIPLYSIYDSENLPSSKKLHFQVLTEIARNRIESLKNDVEDEILTYKEIFGYDKEELSEEDLDNVWTDRINDWVNSVYEFLNAINEKEIPVIELKKEEMSKAIYTFEYVNKSGTPLSVL